VAIAVWDEDDWKAVVDAAGDGGEQWASLAGLGSLAERQARVGEIEAAVSEWTRARTAEDVAGTLQRSGVEAVPVADFADAYSDAQLWHRGHYVEMEHPFLGPGAYERNGFRLSDAPGGYGSPSPTIGQDNAYVLCELLGMHASEVDALTSVGVLE
jgi:benzylsuccinate CoA-transferase BbsF subunit